MDDEPKHRFLERLLSQLKKRYHLENTSDLAEEIDDLVYEGQTRGLITDEESDMIHSVLYLKETTASSIMIPRTHIISASIYSTLEEIIKLITECGHTRIPIFEDNIDKIVGLLHAKDLLKLFSSEPGSKIPREILRKPYFVPGNQAINKLLKDLKSKKTHIAVVTDEYGGTAGIITIEDILEEIVGEIMDEHDHDPPLLTVIDKSAVIVDARLEIKKIEEYFDIDFPEGEYESIGGFIIHTLGRIPKSGEKVSYEDLEILTESADDRRINKIRVIRKTAETDG
ncbi:MAG: HlyC/CorC family transporter [Deltaproteobacteria bacterium]|nr:HlyC/CorC family transporter [Deltaproteobacteria bacterium]